MVVSCIFNAVIPGSRLDAEGAALEVTSGVCPRAPLPCVSSVIDVRLLPAVTQVSLQGMIVAG